MNPFRQAFLDQVQVVISKEANKETLHELLKIGTPSFASRDLLNESTRSSAFRTLKVRLHPDKHLGTNDTTVLFQDTNVFYDTCCECLKSNKKRKAQQDFPQHFRVYDKWPFLTLNNVLPCTFDTKEEDVDLLAFAVAQCVNARGVIAHGQPIETYITTAQCTERFTSTSNGEATPFQTFGGTKYLTGVEDIKEELMSNGPVVSSSFVPTQAVISAAGSDSSLLQSRVNQPHQVIIVGWEHTVYGQVWLVKSLNGQLEPIRIAFGQFGIDTTVLAPKSSFENTLWMSGPYLDISFVKDEWLDCPTVSLFLTEAELRTLAECFDSGRLYEAIFNRSSFVIRDKNKRAHSRRYCLNEIEWNKETSFWNVYASRSP